MSGCLKSHEWADQPMFNNLKFYPPSQAERNQIAVASGIERVEEAAALCGRFVIHSGSGAALYEVVLPPLTQALLATGQPLPVLQSQSTPSKSTETGSGGSGVAAAGTGTNSKPTVQSGQDVKSASIPDDTTDSVATISTGSVSVSGGGSGGSASLPSGSLIHRFFKRMDCACVGLPPRRNALKLSFSPEPIHCDVPELLLTRLNHVYLAPTWFIIDYSRWRFISPPQQAGGQYYSWLGLKVLLALTPNRDPVTVSGSRLLELTMKSAAEKFTPYQTASALTVLSSRRERNDPKFRSAAALCFLPPDEEDLTQPKPVPKKRYGFQAERNYAFCPFSRTAQPDLLVEPAGYFPLPTDHFIESMGVQTHVRSLPDAAPQQPMHYVTRRFDRARYSDAVGLSRTFNERPAGWNSLPLRFVCEIPVWCGDENAPTHPQTHPLPSIHHFTESKSAAAKNSGSSPAGSGGGKSTGIGISRLRSNQISVLLASKTPLPAVLIVIICEYEWDSVPHVFWLAQRLNDPQIWPKHKRMFQGRYRHTTFEWQDLNGPLVLCAPEQTFTEPLRPTHAGGGDRKTGEAQFFREPECISLDPRLVLEANMHVLQASPDGAWLATLRDDTRWTLRYTGVRPNAAPVASRHFLLERRNVRSIDHPKQLTDIHWSMSVARGWFSYDSQTFYVTFRTGMSNDEREIVRVDLKQLLSSKPLPEVMFKNIGQSVELITDTYLNTSGQLTNAQSEYLDACRARTMNQACDGMPAVAASHRNDGWRFRHIPSLPVWRPVSLKRFVRLQGIRSSDLHHLIGTSDYLVVGEIDIRTQIILSLRHHNRSHSASGFGSSEYEAWVERKRAARELWARLAPSPSADAVSAAQKEVVRILYPNRSSGDVKTSTDRAGLSSRLLSVDDRQLVWILKTRSYAVVSLAHARIWHISSQNCADLQLRRRTHKFRCWYVRPLSVARGATDQTASK